MIKVIKCFLMLICLVGIHSVAGAAEQWTFAPSKGKTLLFIGQDEGTIKTYTGKTGHNPVGVMVYTSVQEARGLWDAAEYGSGIQHADALAKQYPDAAIQVGLYMVDALEGIIDGTYNDNIDKIGEWIKTVNRPVYMRIGYEFDLPQNKYEPELYREAYRYIVDRWRASGVKASYVWHSYGFLNAEKPMMGWYPGDEYVDWFGFSFFQAFNDGNLKWMTNRAKEHGKPMMLAEATPFGIGTRQGDGSWRRWFKPFFDAIEKYDIEAACYINSSWEDMPMWKGQGWGDARVEEDIVVKEQWLKEISRNRFIRSDMELFKQIGF